MNNTFLRFLLVASFFPLWQPTVRVQAAQAQVPEYISPLPDSNYNPAGSTIAIRYGDRIDAASLGGRIFNVSGSASGTHSGRSILATDHKTVIFKPDRPFAAGEKVTVQIQAGITSTLGRIFSAQVFSFSVSRNTSTPAVRAAPEVTIPTSPPASKSASPQKATAAQYVTVPSDFPVINVTTPANQTAEGYIFASNWTLPNPGSYLMILDNNGQPVFYQKMPGTSMALDFKVLSNGNLSYWDQNVSGYRIMDSTYHVINTILPGNGYTMADDHDLQLLPNGDYLYMIYDVQPVDMSSVITNGNPNASVIGLIIQEQDPQQNIVFEWRSWDHIPITDSNQDLTAAFIDYVHGNAIALDIDGSFLLSARHLDAILKIDHQTGNTIWTLGGKANQFTFESGPGINDILQFYFQHDIRRLPNGDLTLFDNHNDHDQQVSRALEYSIDEVQKTATLVWEYQETPGTFTPFMGNVQRMANGNTFIGWGGNFSLALTEVKPDLSKALEMNFNGAFISYRAFRFLWHGYPTWAPTLALEPANNSLNLTFSWNGATEIASYKILAGNTTQTNVLLGVQPKAGFETSAMLSGLQHNYCYYRVLPINLNGQETQYSNLVLNPACGTKSYLPLIAQ